MIDWIIEGVKFVGGVGGLASSAFLIYDRVFRNQPLAFLVPADFKTNLRITNVAPETIIIDKIDIDPPVLKVAKRSDLYTDSEDSAASMYPTMQSERTPKGTYIVIKPKSERTFALHFLADLDTMSERGEITIRCKWINTRKRVPFPRYIRLRTTVGVVRNIKEFSFAGKA